MCCHLTWVRLGLSWQRHLRQSWQRKNWQRQRKVKGSTLGIRSPVKQLGKAGRQQRTCRRNSQVCNERLGRPKRECFLIKTHENFPRLSLTKPSAASLELTEEVSAPKQLAPCLTRSPTTRRARAEILQPTNGRESQAPAATLQWGPHVITPVAQPQGECWVSIQHIPNEKSWGPNPFLESSHPKPVLQSSPVIEQSWPPESVQTERVRAATHITGDNRGSLLASLNIRTLTDAKLRTSFEWMQMSGVVALVLSGAERSASRQIHPAHTPAQLRSRQNREK